MSIVLKKIAQNYHKQTLKKRVQGNHKKYIQIYELIKQMIMAMDIPENSILPPTRTIATELNVSRSTALRAYEFLILDGLIASIPGSGYVLKKNFVQNANQQIEHKIHSDLLSEIGKSFLENSQHILSNSSQNIAFAPGLPPLDIFPVSQWKNLSNLYWKEIKFSNLSYSPSSGIEKLKINIANYLNLTRNIKCDPNNIIIASGSLQSLYLIGCVVLNQGENIFLENPTFPNVKAIFRGLLANIIGIPIDEHGISVDYLNDLKVKAKLIHTTPSCHYPSGIKMPLERRLQLLNYANEKNAIIIENDYEHELNNFDNPLPSLFSLDENERTIYLGTLNRLLHPSLRIGYMIVPENLKLPIELLLKHSHRFVSPSIQVVLNQFIEKKYLFNHMDNVIKATIDRKLYFNQIFNNLFNEMGMKILENDTLCLQSLIKLNEGISDADFVSKLAANNISVHSYNKCFIGESNKQGLIMGHCSMPKPVIKNKLSQMFSILAS